MSTLPSSLPLPQLGSSAPKFPTRRRQTDGRTDRQQSKPPIAETANFLMRGRTAAAQLSRETGGRD